MEWTARLDGERAVSWNKWWRGGHWSDRAAWARRAHLIIRAEIDPDVAIIATGPVDIWITAYYRRRAVDSSNICTKPYIDGLIGWIIPDDGPEDVRWVHALSVAGAESDAVEIRVASVDGASV